MGPETIKISRKLRTDTQISLGLIVLIILWCEALSVLEKIDVGQFRKFIGAALVALGDSLGALGGLLGALGAVLEASWEPLGVS